MQVSDLYTNINSWVSSLHTNEVQLIGAIIGSLTTVLVAYVAVKSAFKQIAKQFEYKVIHAGWSEFQKELFNFSKAFSSYQSVVSLLQYYTEVQDQPYADRHWRQERLNELAISYNHLQEANIAFLRSFETHEVIFLPLAKMKSTFQKEYRTKVADVQQGFIEKLFPDIYELKELPDKKETKKLIKGYLNDLFSTSVLLEDFRIELQNITVGKILGKTMPLREPEKGFKILTRNGYIVKK